MTGSTFRTWFEREDRGGSAVEYGLLVSGIAAVIAVAVYTFGGVAAEIARDNCEQIAGASGKTVSTACQ